MSVIRRHLKILIADDHAIMRDGLKSLLEGFDQKHTLVEVSTGKALLKKLEKHHYDLVLLDLSMPEIGGLEAMIRIAQDYPYLKVIILSMHKNMAMLKHLYTLGIAGYVTKDNTGTELLGAIDVVLSGELYFSPDIRDVFFKTLMEEEVSEVLNKPLTKRETEVLREICKEKTGKEIADDLCLSPDTVNRYRKILLTKTGCKNMAGLVLFAVKNGYHEMKY
ncbi:MAG: DNA-binding NarL/FixJ family response regulator [Luteibaculaceae bacterium]|jgi:DNA-binding NarL/FixJ family response regulator